MKKNIEVNELKKNQLDILKSIDEYCKKYNLRYFLAYGTLLGAVRHKGFIPWDDDIDIIMLREDYEKFVMNFKDERYKVFATELFSEYPYPYAKVGDTKTYFEEEVKDKFAMGVNIDVFPIDKLPQYKMSSILRKRNFLQNVWTFKRLPCVKRRGLMKNIILFVLHVLLLPFPMKCIVKKMDSFAKKYRSAETMLCGNLVCGYDPDVYPILDFKESVYLPFEGYSFPCPKNYDNVLKIMFGDYMKLPPKEKQVSHHHFIAYWK